MIIGTKIKEKRKAKNLTQVNLAKQSGISQGLISRIESNSFRMNKEQLSSICLVLDVEPSFLIWESMEEKDLANNKKLAYKRLKPLVDTLINNMI